MTARNTRTSGFFILTFLITWGLQWPGVLAQWGYLPGDPKAYLPFVGLGIFGPLVAAIVFTARQDGKPGVKALFSRLTIYKVSPLWYVVALLVPAALLTLTLGLINLAGRTGPIHYIPPLAGLVVGVLISVVEELGWRGYALPRMEKRFGALGASLFLGIIWATWHIPMFLGAGMPIDLVLVVLLYFTGASLFISWIAKGTGGSLLLVSLAHFGAHLNNSNAALPGDSLPFVVQATVFAALGLFVMRSTFRASARASTRTTAVILGN